MIAFVFLAVRRMNTQGSLERTQLAWKHKLHQPQWWWPEILDNDFPTHTGQFSSFLRMH